MKYDTLPRGYISWSQMQTLERSPMEYVETYIRNKPRFVSEPMMFGKRFADAMETGDTGDEGAAFKFLVDIGVPRYDTAERKIECTYNGINLVGIMDTADHDLLRFREYKTSSVGWSQSRVDKHGQLIFYGAMVYLIRGVAPVECHLDWIRTQYGAQGEIEATGEVQTFKRKPFTLLEMATMLKRITKTADVIVELARQYNIT